MNVHYKELTDRAYQYHNSGEYDKAKELYLQILALNPDDANILNLLGLIFLSSMDAVNAIKYLSQAFLLKKNLYVASNLAKAYFINKDYTNAIKLFETALTFGESDDVYYSLALAYKKSNNIEKAILCYNKALKINPKHYNSLFNLSNLYIQIKDPDKALFYLNFCESINKNHEIYSLYSECFQYKNRIDLAIEYLEKAIALNNKNYIYYFNYGALLTKQLVLIQDEFNNIMPSIVNLVDETTCILLIIYHLYEKSLYLNLSVHAYIKSVRLNPHNIKAYKNLANILYIQKKIYRCIKILNTLIKENPQFKTVYNMLAECYMSIGDFEKALKNYDKAIEFSGCELSLLKGRGTALKYLGRNDEAKAVFKNLSKKYPSNVDISILLGMFYLTEKKFKYGYERYINRSIYTSFNKIFKDKIWNKETELNNKDVLIYTDCGFGDSIMYSRYINMLSEIAKSVTLQTDTELVSLFKKNFNKINIIRKGEKFPNYDIVIPIMNIQYALDSDFNSIPNADGYLIAQKKNILISKKPKIGLFWHGSDKVMKNRSIPSEIFEEITTNYNFEYYSFQLDKNIKNTISLEKYIKDFYDTAQLLKDVDLLITIDSSIVHLAGALGIKTWLLLPYVSEWRWFEDTKTTPWYNSVRIFKQEYPGKWDKVIQYVNFELENLCK